MVDFHKFLLQHKRYATAILQAIISLCIKTMLQILTWGAFAIFVLILKPLFDVLTKGKGPSKTSPSALKRQCLM